MELFELNDGQIDVRARDQFNSCPVPRQVEPITVAPPDPKTVIPVTLDAWTIVIKTLRALTERVTALEQRR